MDLRQLAISHIKPTQENHYRRSRNDEGQSRQNASQQPALQIANIDRQLERFGSRQHVTESHDLYKAIFRKPFPLLDHVIEHHRDLRHGSADVYKAKKEEVQKHLSPGRHLMFLISYAFEFAFLNSHSHYFFRVRFLFVVADFCCLSSVLSSRANKPSKMMPACCRRFRSSLTFSHKPSIIALSPTASSR